MPANEQEIARLTAERDALARFKAYVHDRLDKAGVPADPDSPHKAEGCRIGGRLDVVLKERDALHNLRNLLAVIFRDGGHRQTELADDEEAVRLAKEDVLQTRARLEAAEKVCELIACGDTPVDEWTRLLLVEWNESQQASKAGEGRGT